MRTIWGLSSVWQSACFASRMSRGSNPAGSTIQIMPAGPVGTGARLVSGSDRVRISGQALRGSQ